MPARKVEIDNKYDIQKILTLLESLTQYDEVILHFKKDNEFYKNSNNLLSLQKIAKNYDKTVKFEAEDENHYDYIDSINNNYININEEEVDLDDAMHEIPLSGNKKSMFKLPKITLPKFSMPMPFKSNKSSIVADVEVNSDDVIEGNVEKFNFGLIKILLIFLVIIGVLTGLVLTGLYYIPNATIKLELESEVLVKLLDVKANTSNKDLDIENNIIPATSLQVEESEKQSLKTTGKKEVGEFASGTVTVFNKTDKEKRIKKGTIIKLKKDDNKDNEALTYALLDEIKVPAQEVKTVEVGGSQTQGNVFGSKDVKIKAVKIGSEYNLDDKQKFEVTGQDDDEVYAENGEKITKGDRREVNVVANDDILTIKKTIEDALKTKLKDSLKRKVVDGQNLNEGSISYENVKADFSKKLDEEADDLELTLTMKASGIAYLESDLKEVVKNLARKVVPEEFKLANEDYEYEVAVLKVPNDLTTVNLQVKLRSYITPNVDEEIIRNDLVGVKITEAEEYLNNIRNVKNYEIALAPKLPAFLSSMPKRKENIKLEIKR